MNCLTFFFFLNGRLRIQFDESCVIKYNSVSSQQIYADTLDVSMKDFPILDFKQLSKCTILLNHTLHLNCIVVYLYLPPLFPDYTAEVLMGETNAGCFREKGRCCKLFLDDRLQGRWEKDLSSAKWDSCNAAPMNSYRFHNVMK